MIDHATLGIDTTVGLRTGVHTLQVLARLVGRTFCIGGTFRSAGHIGISKVLRNTLAGGSSASG